MTLAIPLLSVVIPCLNESERLPLLLADLQLGSHDHELVTLADNHLRRRSSVLLTIDPDLLLLPGL